MQQDILKVLLTEEEISAKVAQMGAQIQADYTGKNLVFVTVLKGAVLFMADLMRQVQIPSEIDFMVVSSYGARVSSSGVVRIVKDLDIPLEGKDVLIIEDILDSGLTLSHLKTMLLQRGPASVRVATLLDKPARRTADIKADYAGFVIPDDFVVGYGLDYDEKYRNLPFIGVLKPEVYTQ
ncbi:hypoxanthine phosphoribosyltransferase [Ruminococcaceae bacterium OttesenSCG-928-N02]|nr:hypoxanthine phosphoribosyltransferase [Ruminococcaceae bacterium OttesenSCG-928-N02]